MKWLVGLLFFVGSAWAQNQLQSPQACVKCHQVQSASQPSTSMGHALELAANCSILKSHPLLTFKSGPYQYKIERHDERSLYTVSDGHDTFSVEIQYAFGLGTAGQTYVYTTGGQMYQSRVSFYSKIDGLDSTLGVVDEPPRDLLTAAGRIMDRSEQAGCFGCHSSGAVAPGKTVHLERMLPGVHCENCHGNAETHATNLSPMKSLRHLTAEESANFCGQCHRTWDDIASSGNRGIANVRFQPYRLTNSKCFDPDDNRIACTTCHDPHKQIDSNVRTYDSKCQACHAAAGANVEHCPHAASGACVTCHMPKIELPGSHKQFTDHQIRIVRLNEPYPN